MIGSGSFSFYERAYDPMICFGTGGWRAEIGKGEVVDLPDTAKDLNDFSTRAGFGKWLRRFS